jgi:hypothetical protein
MPRTPDRFPGELQEEGILMDVDSVHPTANGEIRYVSGVGFRFFEEGAETGLSGSGLSPATHQVLHQLIHFISDGPAEGFASGAYKETLPSADPFPTSVIWWESSSKLKKIVEKTVTWGTGPKVPTQIEWKMYGTDGSTVLATVSDAIAYTGVFEMSRTRTIS